MMSRSFTRREKILLLVLCILLLGILYYRFVYKTSQELMTKYDTTDLELDLQAEETKAARIQTMKDEIAQNTASDIGIIASYNNNKNEIAELNDIFSGVEAYNIDFAQPVQDGDAVRRNISVTFTVSGYAEAENIIKSLNNCKYRCVLRTVSIEKTGNESGSPEVNVSVEATFFETMSQADSNNGLEQAKKDNEENTESETE